MGNYRHEIRLVGVCELKIDWKIFWMIAPIIMFMGIVGCTTSNSTQQEKAVQAKPAPYVIKKRPECLYVPESSVPPGMSFGKYKKQLKQQTGVKCLYWTGG